MFRCQCHCILASFKVAQSMNMFFSVGFMAQSHSMGTFRGYEIHFPFKNAPLWIPSSKNFCVSMSTSCPVTISYGRKSTTERTNAKIRTPSRPERSMWVATVEGTANQRQMDCNYQSRRFAPFVKFITTDFSVICLYNLVKFSKMFGCVNFPAINIYFVQQRLNNKKEVSSLLLRLLLYYLIIIIILL